MPPRYVYWTIIVDGQPTAFRSGSLEDIMPTFNRLKEKQPTAELKWFQNGQLWPSRHDAQEAVRARGGRAGASRQSSDSAETAGKSDDPENPRPERAWNAKPEWKTRTTFKPRGDRDPGSGDRDPGSGIRDPRTSDRPAWVPKDKGASRPDPGSRIPDPGSSGKPAWTPKDKNTFRPDPGSRIPDPGSRIPDPGKSGKPEWKPKGTFKPKEAGHRSGWGEKPGWKPTGDTPAWRPKDKSSFRPDPGSRTPDPGKPGKPAWKAKTGGSAREQARSSFRPKSYTPKGDEPRASSRERSEKLDWKPASAKASARQAPDSRPGGPNAGFAKSDPDAPKRKWVPKAEYKKSLGIEVKRDDKWRPGGEHVDPKQKYKDAKKAKWTRVKATIRARSSKPRKRQDDK